MAGVVVAVGLLWLLTVLISNRTVTPRGPFEQDAFEVGRVSRLARRVPFLLPDASPNRARDVYVQHLGDDEEEGWLVFSALAPGQTDRECFLRWDERRESFRDPCEGTEFPADGTGLTQFPSDVSDDGTLTVDLNPE